MALTRKKCEECDRLVQNPFLAFYQRWPWFAHNTPLLNLWTHTQRHSGRFIVFFLLRSIPDVRERLCLFFCALFELLHGFLAGSWCVAFSVGRVYTATIEPLPRLDQ